MDVLEELRHDAKKAETMTSCLRRGTAARVMLDYRILALRVNGDGHCTNLKGRCGCTHAEVRAVIEVLRSGAKDIEGQCSLWVTLSPCTACANLCVYSHLFKRVVYLRPLEHDLRGIHILRRAGIEVVKAEEL